MGDDATDAELRSLRAQQGRLRLAGPAHVDDVYGSGAPVEFVSELEVDDAMEVEEQREGGEVARKLASYTAPKALLAEIPRGQVDEVETVRDMAARRGAGACLTRAQRRSQAFGTSRRIADREDDYRKRRLNRALSPARHDALAKAVRERGGRARSRSAP